MALQRRALPTAELRALGGPAALERCLRADGSSIEEGGVVVGWLGVLATHQSEEEGQGDCGAKGSAGCGDRIWLSALLTENSGLVLLAESDVLRRSVQLLTSASAK